MSTSTNETDPVPSPDKGDPKLKNAKVKLKQARESVEAAKKAVRETKKEIKSLKKEIKQSKKKDIYKGKKLKKARKISTPAVVDGL